MKGVKKDLVMSLPFIYTIGDKWLWMCKCNLEYNGDMNQAATIAQEQYGMSWAEVGDLMGRVSDFIHQYRRHYLVRVSDGAIFPWENAPEKVRGVRGNAMEQRDLYGIVEPFGNGDSIVYINTNRQIVLLYATPAGLQERVLSPSEGTDYTKAMFVAPTNDGYIGTILTNEITMNTINCHGTGEACVFTPDGTRIDIGKYQRYTSDDGTHAKEAEIRDERELCALNGTLYYITRASDSNAAQLREVSISDGNVSIDNTIACSGLFRFKILYPSMHFVKAYPFTIKSASSAILTILGIFHLYPLNRSQKYFRTNIKILQYGNQINIFLFTFIIMSIFCHNNKISIIPLLHICITF